MKFLVFILFGFTLLQAVDGEKVFERKCHACHSYYISQVKLDENFVEENNTLLHLKAPTLNQLSFILKSKVGDRTLDKEAQSMELEEFIQEYLNNFDKNKSILPAYIVNTFVNMPCFKGKLDEDEVEAVTDYIYDYGESEIIKHSVPRYLYKEAVQKAKKEKKIILLEGYITFCRGCIQMDQEVMVDSKVINALNKDFVFTKINVMGEKLPLGLKTIGTPAFYFIDSNGTKVLYKTQGTGSVDEFLELLELVKEKRITHKKHNHKASDNS